MSRLLKFEFRKLFRQKSFYICGIILLGLILLTTFTMNLLLEMSQSMIEADGVSVTVMGDESTFTGLYMLATALSNSNFSIVFAVFVSLFVCSDHIQRHLEKCNCQRLWTRSDLRLKIHCLTGCSNCLYGFLLVDRFSFRYCSLGRRQSPGRPDRLGLYRNPSAAAAGRICIYFPVFPDFLPAEEDRRGNLRKHRRTACYRHAAFIVRRFDSQRFLQRCGLLAG